MRLAPALALLVLGACVPEYGPLMAAGRDCLACHDGASARHWTVAGTWGGRGSSVSLTDANGRTLTLRTNLAGNFYTAEPLALPLAVAVDGKAMTSPVTYAGCNKCHAGGGAFATGPEMMPGADCLSCHDGAGVRRFTLAGTWPPAGATVVAVDATGRTFSLPLPTNAVGNFYTDEPLVFPLQSVSVGGQTMGNVPHGSCNRCHGGGGGDDGGD